MEISYVRQSQVEVVQNQVAVVRNQVGVAQSQVGVVEVVQIPSEGRQMAVARHLDAEVQIQILLEEAHRFQLLM